MKHFSTEIKAQLSAKLENQLVYQFPTHTHANRFLNELKHWSLHRVKARLHKASFNVIVKYVYDDQDFDYTSSDLDELAKQYGGAEE